MKLEVVYRDLTRFFAEYTSNLSKGGTFIGTFAPLKTGSLVLFQLKIPSMDQPIELAGEVVRVATKGNPGMGIRFVWDDEARRLEFERLVEGLMVDTLGADAAQEMIKAGRAT
jgi:type IV pilus assembly protein PilZ